MTKTQAKKYSLLAFIEYKLKHGGDTDGEIKKTLKKLKTMSYKSLREYAIRNDFIDDER